MRTAPNRKGSVSWERVRSCRRSMPDRIAAIVRHTAKLEMLSGDTILSAVIVLAVLYIALVWYDGSAGINSELVSEAEALLMARDKFAKSAALNWSADVPIEAWDGVTVDLQTRRVTRLILRDSQLAGMIPPELGTLTDLSYLDLRGNQLTGAIPAELGHLVNLETLYLHGNQLSGTIPAELGDLSYLQRLWLSNNQLNGPIPSELGQLSNLEELNLRGNQLTGSIPAELGQLFNLKTLYLHDNQLSGTIPAEIGDLSNLQQLWLSNNQLTGRIPTELGKLRSLARWRLGRNRLEGCVPKGFEAVGDTDFDHLVLEVCDDL